MTLPTSTTGALLTSVPAAFHGGINDALLTALVLAVAHWGRRRQRASLNAVLIDVEGHGREEIFPETDLTRTVGWFTSLFPVRLDPGALDLDQALSGGPALGRALKRIKEQLRAVPDNGLGFGLLRYLNPRTAETLANFASPQIGFNYLGRVAISSTGDWANATEADALDRGEPDMPLAHGLELNALTLDEPDGPKLQATWTFAPALIAEAAVHELGERWFRALSALVRHTSQAGAGGRSPSDLRLVDLSQAEIERLERTYAR
jgi:non-ribosomal peptide synthase protein (TIGR01720 family)